MIYFRKNKRFICINYILGQKIFLEISIFSIKMKLPFQRYNMIDKIDNGLKPVNIKSNNIYWLLMQISRGLSNYHLCWCNWRLCRNCQYQCCTHQCLINIIKSKLVKKTKPHKLRSSPSQTMPSPDHPDLHAHIKLPFVLMQSAFASQLSVSVAHSFSSEKRLQSKT